MLVNEFFLNSPFQCNQPESKNAPLPLSPAEMLFNREDRLNSRNT